MAREVARGDVWMYQFARPDKLRPVVILSRPAALEVMHTALVAPITSTIRGIPSEVIVGVSEGLKHDCAVKLDNVQCVDRSRLKRFVGMLGPAKLHEVCRALAIATGCD